VFHMLCRIARSSRAYLTESVRVHIVFILIDALYLKLAETRNLAGRLDAACVQYIQYTMDMHVCRSAK